MILRKIIAVILFALFFQGCSTTLPPKVDVPSNAKIGVMLLIDENPKHVDIGTTIFNNSVKVDASDWGIKKEIYEYLKSALSSYDVALIQPSEKLLKNRYKFISSGWDSIYLNEDLTSEISSVTRAENIDFLVTIEPFNGAIEISPTINASGYGLYTRCSFGMCIAKVLNHVTSRVYAMNPPRLVSWGVVSKYDIPIDISSFDDISNSPKSVIDEAREPFVDYLIEDIQSALARADMNFK